MLSVENIISLPSNLTIGDDDNNSSNASQAQQVIGGLASPYGDHLMLLNIYENYQEAKKKTEWCKENFINHRSMKQVLKRSKKF